MLRYNEMHSRYGHFNFKAHLPTKEKRPNYVNYQGLPHHINSTFRGLFLLKKMSLIPLKLDFQSMFTVCLLSEKRKKIQSHFT